MNKKEGASPWTPEEDSVLLESFLELGNKWTCISRLLPGRTDNAVKNRHALLQRKRGAQRQGSPTQMRKRSKQADPALAVACGRYETQLLHAPPVPYNSFVHPSEFMASPPHGPDNFQLMWQNMNQLRPGMQHIHPNMQYAMHPSLQPLFHTQAHIKPEHAPSLSSQYGGLPNNAYGYSCGHAAAADSVYGLLHLFNHQAALPHQHPVALGHVASGTGTAGTANAKGTANSAGTVTGHPSCSSSLFHQGSMLSTAPQAASDAIDDPLQRISSGSVQDCLEHTRGTSAQQK